MTYGEVGTSRSAIGSGLVRRHLQTARIAPKSPCFYCSFAKNIYLIAFLLPQGSCVGLYFVNRTEWLVVDHACSAYSFVSVPLYDTLG